MADDEERKQKRAEYMKRYYAQNAEYRAASKARAKAHREAAKAADPEAFAKRAAGYAKAWRDRHPEKSAANKLKQNRAARARAREFIIAIKRSTPCADCGGFFHPVCMDFDHVNGVKESALSVLVGRGATNERLMREIAKCELVCANCHRVRTWVVAEEEGIDMEGAT